MSSGHTVTCLDIPLGLWIRGDGALPSGPASGSSWVGYMLLPSQQPSGTTSLWHHHLFFSGYSKQNLMAFLISKHCEILSHLLFTFIYRCLCTLHKTRQRSALLLRAGCAGWSKIKIFSRNGETWHFQVKQSNPPNPCIPWYVLRVKH